MADSKAADKNGLQTESSKTEVTVPPTTFESLGVTEILCESCERLGWRVPTNIQQAALPHALAGKDIIGLAETGSGKTAAFALPVLQELLKKPQKIFALILTPTRELAFQISEQFAALGSSIALSTAVIVGGMDMVSQAIALAKQPHVIVATPGRLVDHLENTKGFTLRSIKFLILDEADRMLNMDFEVELDKILKVLPKERRTYLYSATMTKKVNKLQRASLRADAVTLEVSSKYQTVEKLNQKYLFIPAKHKDLYLTATVNELSGNSVLVFCATCSNCYRVALLLRSLGFDAVPLHGQLNQTRRLAALAKFKARERCILVATDVASRGLDIPQIDAVINYDVPGHLKDYIHRVGRTARAGRSGVAITFVTQYDVESYQKIEAMLGQKFPLFDLREQEVMVMQDRVAEAQRIARIELHQFEEKRKGGRGKKRGAGNDGDAEHGEQLIKRRR